MPGESGQPLTVPARLYAGCYQESGIIHSALTPGGCHIIFVTAVPRDVVTVWRSHCGALLMSCSFHGALLAHARATRDFVTLTASSASRAPTDLDSGQKVSGVRTHVSDS